MLSRRASSCRALRRERCASGTFGALTTRSVEIGRRRSSRRSVCKAGGEVGTVVAPAGSVERVAWAEAQEEARGGGRRDGPLVVSFDKTPDARDALMWTANNLCRKGEKLLLLHVMCDPLLLHTPTATGTSPGGWVISADSADFSEDMNEHVESYRRRLAGAAEAALAAACGCIKERGIEYELDLPMLPVPPSAAIIGETLLAHADEARGRLLVVASHGPGALADFGSVVRYCFHNHRLPLVLVPKATDTAAPPPPPRDVVLLVNSLDELEANAVWLADHLCQEGDALQVWHTGSGTFEVPPQIAEHFYVRGKASGVTGTSINEEGLSPESLGSKVCAMVESPGIRAVAAVNHTHSQGLVREALQGSLASHLARHCHKPLLLLPEEGGWQ